MTSPFLNKQKWFKSLMWLLLFGFFFSIANYFQPFVYALIYALFDTIALFCIYNVSYNFIFPRYYHHFRKYLLISITFVIIYTFLYYLIDVHFIPKVPDESITPPPKFFHFFRKFVTSCFFYFIGTAVSLVEHNQQLIEKEKLLTEEKLQTELKLLKAQINPHFIFNALNNIYSLTYMKADNAPDSVLKLSEMLRYVFYDCNKDKVQISAEIKYIENFCAFQQMKSEQKQNINLTQDNVLSNIEIAPMIFIPFIENAFKYSRIEEEDNAFVNINISAKENHLSFFIENSISLNNKPISGSGTGIKNVKHRLAIIYPDNHQLEINDENDKFSVNLEIGVRS